MEVKAIFDQSTFVRTSYDGLKREIVQALILISLVILLFLQSSRPHRRRRHPHLVRDHPHRVLRYRADPQRVHARRPHAGHGPPGRHLRRRARVDPPAPPRRRDAGGGRPRGDQRGRRAGAGRDADHRRGAAAGDAAERPREEAVRPARADRRRRHVCRLSGQHAGHAPRVPVPAARQEAGRVAAHARARRPPRRRQRRRARRRRLRLPTAPWALRPGSRSWSDARCWWPRASGWRRACRARSSRRSTSRWSGSTCASRPAPRSRTPRARSTAWARCWPGSCHTTSSSWC